LANISITQLPTCGNQTKWNRNRVYRHRNIKMVPSYWKKLLKKNVKQKIHKCVFTYASEWKNSLFASSNSRGQSFKDRYYCLRLQWTPTGLKIYLRMRRCIPNGMFYMPKPMPYFQGSLSPAPVNHPCTLHVPVRM